MRGVVTLAAAAAIPVTTATGEPFPERATIQAIAFVVSVGTLLIQGATLPLLISRLGVSKDGTAAEREATLKAERVVHEAADDVLSEFRANPPDGLDPRVLAEIRNTIARHSQDADEMPDPAANTLRAEVFATLYLQVLRSQRSALIAERDAGLIEDEAARAMLERLDLQEAGVSARLESRFYARSRRSPRRRSRRRRRNPNRRRHCRHPSRRRRRRHRQPPPCRCHHVAATLSPPPSSWPWSNPSWKPSP